MLRQHHPGWERSEGTLVTKERNNQCHSQRVTLSAELCSVSVSEFRGVANCLPRCTGTVPVPYSAVCCVCAPTAASDDTTVSAPPHKLIKMNT